MTRTPRLAAIALILSVMVLCGACVHPIAPVYTSTEQRIWVVRDGDEVYRCVDQATGDQPARAFCHHVPMVRRY